MRRILPILLGLVGLQALLAGIYLAAEKSRESAGPVRHERLSWPAPELEYRTLDGARHRLSEQQGQPVLVHFWATWCPPCVEELPKLLELASGGPVRVLAVSVDPDRAAVQRFLGREPPACVVMADGEAAAQAFGFRTLPQSYLLAASGSVRFRLSGPRDWASGAVRAWLAETLPELAGNGTAPR